MRVTLKINDKTYSYATFVSKRKMGGAISRLSEKVGTLEGTCTVHYKGQYKNEFDFSNADELRTKLWPAIEEELVNEFSE